MENVSENRERTQMAQDNEFVVLRQQMLKHNVLSSEESILAKKDIEIVDREYEKDTFRGPDNIARQVKVSKGIAARRRKLITELLENHLSRHDLRQLERIAYLCILNNVNPRDVDFEVSLRIKCNEEGDNSLIDYGYVQAYEHD